MAAHLYAGNILSLVYVFELIRPLLFTSETMNHFQISSSSSFSNGFGIFSCVSYAILWAILIVYNFKWLSKYIALSFKHLVNNHHLLSYWSHLSYWSLLSPFDLEYEANKLAEVTIASLADLARVPGTCRVDLAKIEKNIFEVNRVDFL